MPVGGTVGPRAVIADEVHPNAFDLFRVHLPEVRHLTPTRQDTGHRVEHRPADLDTGLVPDAGDLALAVTKSAGRGHADLVARIV